jgi:hypothetical protein
LFALLHDSRRLSDGEDPGHGARAAQFAASLREQKFFELPDEHFRLLDYACRHHTDGRVSHDATIGAAWDSDRLDLTRIQVKPRPEFMSTRTGREIASGLLDKPPGPGEGPKMREGTFYTIDSRGELRPGLKLVAVTGSPAASELSGGGPEMSPLLIAAILSRFTDPFQGELELVLESVRRTSFPHFPSRQCCLFACDSLEILRKISVITNRQVRGERGIHGKVFELLGTAVGPFDGYCTYNTWGSPRDRAFAFWSGRQTRDPYPEFIVVPPITIGRQVGTI